jgi:hypothetical protein
VGELLKQFDGRGGDQSKKQVGRPFAEPLEFGKRPFSKKSYRGAWVWSG